VFDVDRLGAAVAEARPNVVIHQLTDLPRGLDPARMAEAVSRNARIRDEGTRNLVAAAVRAGAKRLIAQSLGFIYAEGPGMGGGLESGSVELSCGGSSETERQPRASSRAEAQRVRRKAAPSAREGPLSLACAARPHSVRGLVATFMPRERLCPTERPTVATHRHLAPPPTRAA